MHNLSYYETIASLYDTVVPRDIKGVCDSVEEMIRSYTNRETILDLGCGTGRFTIELAKRGFKIVGLDLTDEMLEVARKNVKKANVKVRFIKGDIRDFRLKKGVGIIWARGSIGDLLNLSEVRRAFKNIRKNLLREGVFIFDVRDFSYFMEIFKEGFRSENRIFKQKNNMMTLRFSTKLNKRTQIEEMKGEIEVKTGKNIEKYEVDHTLRHYTRREIRYLLSDAGFNILEIQEGGYRLDKKKKPHLVIVVQK